jgi:hypothetical protein
MAYPGAAQEWSNDHIGASLGEVGLEHLFDRLDEEAQWDQTLSGGEKQRRSNSTSNSSECAVAVSAIPSRGAGNERARCLGRD